MLDSSIDAILQGMSLGYRLKRETRHCWYEDGKCETVAEHCWRVSFLAILIAPHLELSFNQDRLMRIIVVHDICEALTGDYPAFVGEDVKRLKAEKERAAMQQISKMLGVPAGEQVQQLWLDYEERQSIEARIAAALDKIEAICAHLESPLDRWTPEDGPYFSVERYQSYFDIDPLIEALFRRLLADVELKLAKEEGLAKRG